MGLNLPKVWDWQIWVTHDDYRNVFIMQCPNVEGVVVENESREYCLDKIVNLVAGYINDCKNSKREVQLKEAPSKIPLVVTEVLQRHSM